MPYNNAYKFISKRVETWVVVALTIFLLGYFLFPSSSKQNTFFYLSLYLPLAFLLPKYYKHLNSSSWLTITALIFAFYLFLNSLWSIHFSYSQSFKYLRYLLTIYCLFASIFIVNKIPNYSAFLFKAFVFIGFFHSLHGIFTHFNTIQNPLVSRYNDPIDSAMLVGFLLLSCCWFISESSNYRQRLLYTVISIPFIVIIFLSKSRGPQLAVLLSVPLIFYFQLANFKRVLLPIIFLTLLILIFFILTETHEYIFSRGLTFPYRQEIWLASLQESVNYFWFGQGASYKPMISTPDSDLKFNHSHNILLVVFRMGGITGTLLFCINLFLCFFAGLRQIKSIERLWVVWLFFGILCLMTNGKYPLTHPSASWLAYWIPIAFICAAYSNFLPGNSTNSKSNS